jgi:hypothetical protein
MSALDMFPEARVDPGLDLDRRYTTPETMHLIKRLADVSAWDLDAAADAESHWAEKWFGIEADGLAQDWDGHTFVNPPFSDIGPWVKKAWSEWARPGALQTVAMLLPANRTEQPWWQEHVEAWRDEPHRSREFTTHFLPTRVRYGHPGNPRGVGAGSPPFASVLLLWRRS